MIAVQIYTEMINTTANKVSEFTL